MEKRKVVKEQLPGCLRRSMRSRNSASAISTFPPTNYENNPDMGQEMSRSVEDNVEELYGSKNPLKNPLIINHIFGLLDLDDIKQCRLVCSQWNDLSISFVEKISVICLGCPKKGVVYEWTPTGFKEFSDTSQINFRAFKLPILPSYFGFWKKKDLIGFLTDQMENMRELTIENIRVYGLDTVLEVQAFYLTPFISNHLNHLSIGNNVLLPHGQRTKFRVGIDKLASAKSLSFKNCQLDVIKNCRLSAEKLEIIDTEILKNGKRVSNFIVNEIIDFDKIKELKLAGGLTVIDDHLAYELTLNLAGKITLRNLLLDVVEVTNLTESEWKINGQLKLTHIPITQPLKIQFRELDFGHSHLHLDELPNTLEKLTVRNPYSTTMLRMICRTKMICPPEFSFPNLKSLKILIEGELIGRDDQVDYSRLVSSLYVFLNCPNLKTVEVQTNITTRISVVPDQRLHTSWIPRSTEYIFLDGKIQAEGNEINLRKLIIKNNRLDNLISTLNILKSNHLVLELSSKLTKKLEEIILTVIKMPYESVAIGSLEISDAAFRKSSFSDNVDRRAKYYLFENLKGKSIQEWQFRKMTEP